MDRCKNYKQYKGIRKPRCNKGKGCDNCKIRWLEAEILRLTLKSLVRLKSK